MQRQPIDQRIGKSLQLVLRRRDDQIEATGVTPWATDVHDAGPG